MNVVFISPHFPPTYYLFAVCLRTAGANVLGVGEEHYDNLRPELCSALGEYYRVDNMNDYDQTLRALEHFVRRHGQIDHIASHNEHWLELEGYLRERLNIPGKKIEATRGIKHKSLMKKTFREAGIAVAPGAVVHSIADARALIGETGYPIIAKPDRGVGAAATYKLTSDEELREFLRVKPPVEYFMEGFVDGEVVTFDGLVDRSGEVVFYMSLEYSRNIMDVVAENDHVAYWTLRELPRDLVDTGTACVKAFDLSRRAQFFHFEFFRTRDRRLIGLELNARPPGWPTVDMMNYANDADAYREWSNVVAHGPRAYEWTRKYHAIFIGRKSRFHYRHTHEEIVARYGRFLVQTLDIPEIFASAMGQRAYLARSPVLEELRGMQAFVQERV